VRQENFDEPANWSASIVEGRRKRGKLLSNGKVGLQTTKKKEGNSEPPLRIKTQPKRRYRFKKRYMQDCN